MRVIAEIVKEACKITFFQWNNRYIIKLEDGPFEQTFKLNQFDVTAESDLHKIVNERFIEEALVRFREMYESLGKAMDSL